MNHKQQLLDQIKTDIIAKHVCPDLAAQATQLVMGEGSPDADVMFIGEAPGKREDETGRPFVGSSGRFLDELLASIGLRRADVFITSILKYRPPKNRDPLPKEKQAFWPYLLRQIQVIDPKLIVTLGRHGLSCFMPGAVMGQLHGQAKRITLSDGTIRVLLPLYHPAAALYNQHLRRILLADFQQIPKNIDRIT